MQTSGEQQRRLPIFAAHPPNPKPRSAFPSRLLSLVVTLSCTKSTRAFELMELNQHFRRSTVATIAPPSRAAAPSHKVVHKPRTKHDQPCKEGHYSGAITNRDKVQDGDMIHHHIDEHNSDHNHHSSLRTEKDDPSHHSDTREYQHSNPGHEKETHHEEGVRLSQIELVGTADLEFLDWNDGRAHKTEVHPKKLEERPRRYRHRRNAAARLDYGNDIIFINSDNDPSPWGELDVQLWDLWNFGELSFANTQSPTSFPGINTPTPTRPPATPNDGVATQIPTFAPSSLPDPPSSSPTSAPSENPPAPGPAGSPTPGPAASPTPAPVGSPTAGPLGSPTSAPVGSPTAGPLGSPTSGPLTSPTSGPLGSPTSGPLGTPTSAPIGSPTSGPLASPTSGPLASPTSGPLGSPTSGPLVSPTSGPLTSPPPSSFPTFVPSISSLPTRTTAPSTSFAPSSNNDDTTPSVPSIPSTVFMCTDQGVALADPTTVNSSDVSEIPIRVGYIVESVFLPSEYFPALQDRILATSVISALECNEGGDVFGANGTVLTPLLVSVPLVTTLSGSQNCTPQISICTTGETEFEFAVLPPTGAPFNVEAAAFLSYLQLQEQMDSGIVAEQVPGLDRIEYTSPLPLLPSSSQDGGGNTNDDDLSGPPEIQVSATDSVSVSPYTLGAVVAMCVGGIAALWMWARNRQTRNHRHIQLIENMSLDSALWGTGYA